MASICICRTALQLSGADPPLFARQASGCNDDRLWRLIRSFGTPETDPGRRGPIGCPPGRGMTVRDGDTDLPVEAEQVFGTQPSSQNTVLLRGSYRTDDGIFSA